MVHGVREVGAVPQLPALLLASSQAAQQGQHLRAGGGRVRRRHPEPRRAAAGAAARRAQGAAPRGVAGPHVRLLIMQTVQLNALEPHFHDCWSDSGLQLSLNVVLWP